MGSKDTKKGNSSGATNKKTDAKTNKSAGNASTSAGKADMPKHKQKQKQQGSGKMFGGVMLTVAVGLGAACASLFLELQETKLELSAMQTNVNRYTSLSARADNPDWINKAQAEFQKQLPEEIADDTPAALIKEWDEFLDETTPKSWQQSHKNHNEKEDDFERADIDCRDLKNVMMPALDLRPDNFQNSQAAKRATKSLIECGFVYLDNFFDRAFLENIREKYYEFTATQEAEKYFKYPCQGKGRVEHMLPFRQPFNDSALYGDERLRSIIRLFLRADFKLELMTVIESPPGSGDQRWHQGWRYLFHESERLPPYSVVVTVPLDDVDIDMGPTEFCPGKKLRLYHGWRCPEEEVVQAGSSLGTVSIFDYKLLHRGPANTSKKSRPMISMVFTNRFFVNSNAFVNRGITFVQTINQRRFWEQWFWHPQEQAYFVV